MKIKYLASAVLVLQALNTSLFAQTESEKQASADNKILNRITVVDSKEEALKTAGSAYVLDNKAIEEALGGFDDIGRVLAEVPGVNVQDEEGYGLRPNIGFRGVPSERSEGITLMEDGVLIAPAPYSAPAAYFFPSFGRMEQLEILKGPASIKYGPRTLGGSLNMLSTSIPQKSSINGVVGVGEDDSLKGHLNVGKSGENYGWLLEGYTLSSDGFKQLDTGGDTGFDLQDLVGKFRLNSDADADVYQSLEFKINDYNQDSDETYLGLSEEDFNDSPFRRYAASEFDQLDVQHQQYQVRHFIEFNENTDLTTTFYRNNTQRDWYKLESVDGESISDVLDEPSEFVEQYACIRGDADCDSALTVRDNNRKYTATGFQTVAAHRLDLGKSEHKFEFGARYHEDDEDRFQREDKYSMINGRMLLSETGAPGSQSNRIGEAKAWAFHLIDEISYSDFTFTPGARIESIRYENRDYGKNDPTRSGVELKKTESDYDTFIPGASVRYAVSEDLGVFAGASKGFSPPGPTATEDVDEEESVNYETGIDLSSGSLETKLLYFLNDYENLLGADTASSGGSGSGDLFNGGEATSQGIEFSARMDVGQDLELPVSVPLIFSYTYTDSQFDSTFDSPFFGTVDEGDQLPYLAENQLFTSVGVGHESYGDLVLKMRYLDSMKTAAGEAGAKPGKATDEYVVFDLGAEFPIRTDTGKVKLFVDVLNLFDEEYIVARRPAGVRPGLPLTTMVGLKFAF
jgi:Fe(3+) dicitrate transport protein